MKALSDFEKPECPYVAGSQFAVQEHIPQPPQNVTVDSLQNNEDDDEEMMHLSNLDRCLRHPPLQGSTGSSAISLEILRPLRAGDGHNAQLLTVRPLRFSTTLDILGLKKQTCIVAKIYDPLYAEDDGYVNPFRFADKHYTHEAGAYAALSKFQGSKIPRFYGPYTLSIPVEQSAERQVRLILIEFIPGVSMNSAKPESFSRSTRQHILKTIVDFETYLYAHDLVHRDIHPRNIILQHESKSDGDGGVKVIFVDFADVEFSRTAFYSYGVKEEQLLPKTYISPLLRWHSAHSRIPGFKEWIDWDWQSWLDKEFEDTAASITEQMREVFLPD